MKFTRETIAAVLEEVKPLLLAHWAEIAHYKDIPFDPDYDQYLELEKMGVTSLYTARTEENKLIGYALFFIKPHLHYKTCVTAFQDVIYVDPEHRGCGRYLIKFCDEQLRLEGVHVISQHVKAKHNFGPMLERMDYELMDHIFVKRLN